MRKGPLRVPGIDPDLQINQQTLTDETVDLPPADVIDAGMLKFTELARLHWPASAGGFKLTSFDIRNDRQLRMTLGLVYMAMQLADRS